MNVDRNLPDDAAGNLKATSFQTPMERRVTAGDLRPVERRMMRLAEAGILPSEIARRFRRSTAHVQRTLDWAHLPGRQAMTPDDVLRPLERRVLRWRDEGAGLDELSERFRRGRGHLARVLELADLKLEGLARPV